jgi:hypothetical protein
VIGIGATYDATVMPLPFASYSQNGEDVVLWRALGGVAGGRYIEVGAGHPCRDSTCTAFHREGWTGLTVAADPDLAALLREHRRGDIVIEAALTAEDRDAVIPHLVDGTGPSTVDETIARGNPRPRVIDVPTRRLDSVLRDAEWDHRDIHFMSVRTAGSERAVLESIDLAAWRPWVLVVKATKSKGIESNRRQLDDILTRVGYRFCLFDGLSCFYVSEERSQQLGDALSYPACSLDNYTSPALRDSEKQLLSAQGLAEEQAAEARVLREEMIHWRGQVVTRWADIRSQVTTRTAQLQAELRGAQKQRSMVDQEAARLRQEVLALRQRVMDLETSTSWRVTKPLRSAIGLIRQLRGRY